MVSKKKALEMIDTIDQMFPDAECELKHSNPFELTIAVYYLHNVQITPLIK